MTTQLPPLAVYVHIPWCVRKCPYCDFNSHAAEPLALPESAFLSRLRTDIEQDAKLAQGRHATSVFFGGGTPSLMSANAIAEIITMLRDNIGIQRDAEITLEANPGTFEASKFADFLAAGVNRLSIGVQSFTDPHLRALGRIHSADEAAAAIREAQVVGYDNFNIDLMHGLPAQTCEQALADLQQAIALAPTHISWYQLTIEQNTEFFRHPPTLPADDDLWDIQQQGQALLQAEGFQQYEVSAYAKPDKRCQHNLNYWRYGDFLGFGPGAHGKVTQQQEGLSITRTRKTRLPKDYLNLERPLIRLEEQVPLTERAFDYFINTLRLREPVSLSHLEHSTGLAFADIEPVFRQAEASGWLKLDDNLLSTTDSGYLYLNEVLSLWLGNS